jgi:hypothetical protein
MRFVLSALFTRALVPAALVVTLAWPASTFAQAAATQPTEPDHIVSSQALQQQVENSSADRQKHIDAINDLLATPQAEQAMRDSHIDAKQVHDAVPTLSDNELADLAARANHAQQDFAAGLLGVGLFTLIILVIIVIIVVAVVH